MILYLDTSALVPLVIAEPSSSRCRELWNGADAVCCSAIGHVEATAALARAHRGGRLAPAELADAVHLLDELWSDVTVVPADRERLLTASTIARRHGVRGYDAVHCAAALAVAGEDGVAATGDAELLTAWRSEGLAVADTNAS